jgi:hypothetical protein
LIIGLIISSFIYLASYAATLPLLGRFVYFSIFFLQLLLSLYLAELWHVPSSGADASLTRKLLKGASTAIVMLLFIYQIQLMDLVGIIRCSVRFDPKFSIERCSHPKEKFAFLATHLGPGNVVMSDTFTSWVIPAMTGAKVVSLFHDNPLMGDNTVRMNDTRTFFSAGTSTQERMDILKRYGVTHILIRKGLEKFEYASLLREWGIFVPVFNPDLIGSLISLGTIVFRDDTYILAKL